MIFAPADGALRSPDVGLNELFWPWARTFLVATAIASRQRPGDSAALL